MIVDSPGVGESDVMNEICPQLPATRLLLRVCDKKQQRWRSSEKQGKRPNLCSNKIKIVSRT